MNLPKLNDTELLQLFWVILCATVTALLLARLIRKFRDSEDGEELVFLLANPASLLGATIAARLLLIDSDLVRQPPVIALAAIALVGLSAWTMRLFPPFQMVSLDEAPDDSATERNMGLCLQAVLLVTTFDVLVYGSAITCWIWLLFAVVQTLILLSSFTHLVRKHTPHCTEPESRSMLIGGSLAFACALYFSTGLMRNGVTQYYGTAEAGGLWERNQYDTQIKVTVRHHGDSFEAEGTETDAVATVVNHGVFWGRLKELRLKSISFVKGRPQRVKSQEEELWPHEDATVTSITTTKGAAVIVSLTDQERKRFRE